MTLSAAEVFRRGPYDVAPDNKRIVVVYRVESTDGSEDDIEVVNASGIPQISDAYVGRNGQTDPDLRVVQIRVDREKGKSLFLVSVTYDSKWTWGGIEPQPPIQNPLDRPIVTRFDVSHFEQANFADTNLDEYKSSAGEPYPPVTTATDELSITITRNMRDFNVAQAALLTNSINSAAFTLPTGEVVAAGLAKCARVSAEPQYEASIAFWAVQIVLLVRRAANEIPANRSATGVAFTPSPWDEIRPDEGMYQISGTDRKLILDSTKQPVTSPVFLNGAGAPLAPGADAKFQWFQPLYYVDFNDYDVLQF